ncbi:MAG TPA: hypothetical protein VGD37_17830 [Kofleriaceae bacterium]|jgi:hypothetical protein
MLEVTVARLRKPARELIRQRAPPAHYLVQVAAVQAATSPGSEGTAAAVAAAVLVVLRALQLRRSQHCEAVALDKMDREPGKAPGVMAAVPYC